MEKLQRNLAALSNSADATTLYKTLAGVYDRLSSQLFTSGVLAQATTATKLKTTAAINGIAGGVPVNMVATDNLFTPVESQVVAAGYTNVLALFIDYAGTGTCVLGNPATTLGSVKFPPIPQGKMMVGYVIITGGTTDWTGGTSTMTTSTTDYYCTIVNTVGGFDPSAIL